MGLRVLCITLKKISTKCPTVNIYVSNVKTLHSSLSVFFCFTGSDNFVTFFLKRCNFSNSRTSRHSQYSLLLIARRDKGRCCARPAGFLYRARALSSVTHFPKYSTSNCRRSSSKLGLHLIESSLWYFEVLNNHTHQVFISAPFLFLFSLISSCMFVKI